MLKTTTNHDEIKNWAESLKGKPAIINAANEDSLITIHFPPLQDPTIKDISWEEFFDKFEKNNLALQYEPEPRDEKEKMTHKIIEREDNTP